VACALSGALRKNGLRAILARRQKSHFHSELGNSICFQSMPLIVLYFLINFMTFTEA